MFRYLLPPLLCLVPLLVPAQPGAEASVATDLEALNAHFGGSVRFTVDKDDRLLADLFDGGDRYRQDVVYLEFLDPGAFAFSPEERMVVLKCADEHARCIDKEIFKLGTISHSGRMPLPIPSADADGAQALALLRKLVRDAQLALRERSTETRRRGSRRK